MRDDDDDDDDDDEESNNWFAKWDEQLPSPDELISLSQSLISPNLAMAFDIPNINITTTTHLHHHLRQPPLLQDTRSSHPSCEFELFDSGGTTGGGGGGGAGPASEEPARTLKRPRLVWTPQLHKRFVEAVAHLGIKNAVPKTIMQMMSVDGLTRENVASHLQKYRLYLKRMQKGGVSISNAASSTGFVTDTDRLFATSPVPAHFLHPARSTSDHFLPSVPVTTMSHLRHNHQHNHNLRHFVVGTSTSSYGHFNHPFLSRQLQSHNVITSYKDTRPPTKATTNVQKALTLFPSGDD